MRHGQLLDGSANASASIERLARWWTQASQGERFELLRRTIAGEEDAPTLQDLTFAQFLAEATQGEIDQG